ncbi:hypothetical protein [Shewanella sp. 10N.286.51.B7]|uniref:hypothetical protein n=1 Tax=Shewanella sp. 10N.286.51.B7 TaxID=1880836 RepID=UPI0012FFF6D9|nr:hypothetical protein [Shewanella sp. 10N.286.51.B7]
MNQELTATEYLVSKFIVKQSKRTDIIRFDNLSNIEQPNQLVISITISTNAPNYTGF